MFTRESVVKGWSRICDREYGVGAGEEFCHEKLIRGPLYTCSLDIVIFVAISELFSDWKVSFAEVKGSYWKYCVVACKSPSCIPFYHVCTEDDAHT